MIINEIKIKQFKKLRDVNIEFSNINLITGKNATGKSTLLHIISNSVQAPTPKKIVYNTGDISKVKKISTDYNLKFEKLVKGDMKYNDPARGVPIYYTCTYSSGTELDFRKHNSKSIERFSVKLRYKKGKNESLPKVMCIYLGLKRVTPIGEIFGGIINSRFNYSEAEKWISRKYSSITGISLKNFSINTIEGHNNKISFTTKEEGVDSNTISAGQDSLLSIICALYVLKYHNEDAKDGFKESILLIDEFDITLHPEFQFSLMDLLNDICMKHNIQAFMTTHSFEAIKYAQNLKWNILYLINKVDTTHVMPNPTILKIKADLENNISQVTMDPKIPIFFEDNEAFLFYKKIITNNLVTNIEEFSLYTKRVEGSFPCNVIIDLFSMNTELLGSFRSIGILDADQKLEKKHFNNNLLKLPGNASPEDIIFGFLDNIVSENSEHKEFLDDDYILEKGYTTKYLAKINKEIKIKLAGEGRKREINKDIWNSNLELVGILIEYWISKNEDSVINFIGSLKILYNKMAPYHGLDKIIDNA